MAVNGRINSINGKNKINIIEDFIGLFQEMKINNSSKYYLDKFKILVIELHNLTAVNNQVFHIYFVSCLKKIQKNLLSLLKTDHITIEDIQCRLIKLVNWVGGRKIH